MKLLIDIGNTCTKLAVGCSGKSCRKGEIVYIERKNDLESWSGLFSRIGSIYPIKACAVSCVGHYDATLTAALQAQAWPHIWLGYDTPCMLHNTPQGYGSDRLADDLGAIVVLQEQMPHATADDITRDGLLVIDAGTCITYDYVDEHRRYLGGSISPGLGIRLRALHDQTAALPLVSAAGERPEVGYDTETAIRCGVLGGMEYEVAGTIAAWQTKHPQGTVCLTGGNAYRLAQGLHVQRHDCLVEIGLNYLLLHDTAATEASAHGAL